MLFIGARSRLLNGCAFLSKTVSPAVSNGRDVNEFDFVSRRERRRYAGELPLAVQPRDDLASVTGVCGRVENRFDVDLQCLLFGVGRQ